MRTSSFNLAILGDRLFDRKRVSNRVMYPRWPNILCLVKRAARDNGKTTNNLINSSEVWLWPHEDEVNHNKKLSKMKPIVTRNYWQILNLIFKHRGKKKRTKIDLKRMVWLPSTWSWWDTKLQSDLHASGKIRCRQYWIHVYFHN